MNLRLKITRTTEVTLLFLIIIMATAPSAKGLDWSPERRLTFNIAWDVSPSIMQAKNGSIWVVWSSDREAFQSDLYYQTSSDDGLNWSPATPLTSNSSFDGAPSVMQTSNGTIWVVWASDRTDNYEIWYKTSSNNGLNWSNATPLTTNSSRDTAPSILQAADDTIWVVWHRYVANQSDIFYKTSSNNGQTWSNDTRLTTDSSWDKTPSITQTRNGTIWVAWSSYRTKDYEIWYKTFSDGLNWSNANRLTTDPGFDQMPSVVEAVNGSIWVFWSSDRIWVWNGEIWVPQCDIFYKTSSNNGQTWSNDTRLTMNPEEDWTPSTTSTDDGRIWVAWSSLTTGDFEIWYRKTSDPIPLNDVAVVGVTSSTTSVTRGEPVFIQVEVENQGTLSEIFNVTVYANLTKLKPKRVNLAPGASMNLTFVWDTTDFAVGIYTLRAEAEVVAGETDTIDNNYTDGTVTVMQDGADFIDVAVIDVVTSAGEAYPTWTIEIRVTAKNKGTVPASLNVTAYYNASVRYEIGTQTVMGLVAKENVTLTFNWSLSNVPSGLYTISAEAVSAGDLNPANNNLYDGLVRVRVWGDVNGNGVVDLGDVAKLDLIYSEIIKPPYQTLLPDINGNGKVDFGDVAKLDLIYSGKL